MEQKTRVGSLKMGFLLLLGLLWTSTSVQAQNGEFVEDRWVAILSAYPDFASAKKDAEKMAKAANIPFSMEGRIFDAKKGLIYPANYEDEVFAGNYVARRYNEADLKGKTTEYLSVERSDGYAGFKPGLYIVVAGVYESSAEAAKQIARFKTWAPGAYSKKAKIYMGCMH